MMHFNSMSENGSKSGIATGITVHEPQSLIEDASLWRRLANFFIDLATCVVLLSLIGAINACTNIAFRIDTVGAIGPLVIVLIPLLYHLLSEASVGRTVGKIVTRTLVVADSGAKAAIGQILLRTLCRFVPFDALSFLGRGTRGYHDKWSKTRVINLRPRMSKKILTESTCAAS